MGVLSTAIDQSSSGQDSKSPDPDQARQERLGGARADFVANLGRRGAEITGMLSVLSEQRGSVRVRDDLRRRVHALAAGARLLRFTKLAHELTQAETRLELAAQRGELSDDDVELVRGLVRDMPTLAWGQAEALEAPRPVPIEDTSEPSTRIARLRTVRDQDTPAPTAVGGPVPTTVLVVGPTQMADALAPAVAGTDSPLEPAFEVEHTEDMTVAIDLGRAVAPDVVIVDGDRPGAKELVEALGADPLTDFVPVIVTGRFPRPEDAGPFLALGVAKALPKPVSPAALRRACVDVTNTYVHRHLDKDPLGALTLDQLGARLAEELRRGLCDAAEIKGRGLEVSLGEGTEVLAALWGAVARIRDLVTIRSGGAVRFASNGPEGAVPLAPWLGEGGTKEGVRGEKGAGGRVSTEAALDGVTVLVADDDPAVNWFLAGVLKAAGATVHEARDGARALALAQRVSPELVISDVLMPHLDGFALCRALKRDVVLRDVPVILLSWKEDLLQRVRELGADADGYLRKEASAGAIVQRVRELLRRRRRVAERIASGGEVRGRLDGLTTRTLLSLTCAARPTSTILVKDASFLYEVEVREGRPARATRTASDGTFHRGPAVLAALLGVGDGRFVVGPTPQPGEGVTPIRADLNGTLEEQLLPVIATARAAQRLLFGPALMKVDRVTIDVERLGAYIDATPEPARSLLRSLVGGASPRKLITDGQQPSRLVEDVLTDAAAHGAVREVFDSAGEELLLRAIGEEAARLEGKSSFLAARAEAPPPVRPADAVADELVVPEGSLLAEALAVDPFAEEEEPEPSGPRPVVAPYAEESSFAEAISPPEEASSPRGEEPFALSPAARAVTHSGGPEAALAAPSPALDTPEPPRTEASSSDAPEVPPAPARSAALDADSPEPPKAAPPTLDLAIPTPTPTPTEAKRAKAKSKKTPTPTPAELPAPPGVKTMLTLGSLTPPPVDAAPLLERFTRKDITPKPKDVKDRTPKPTEVTPRFPRPSAYLPQPRPAKRESKALMWVGFAVLGVAFALWARWHRDATIPEPLPPPGQELAPVAAAPLQEAAAPPAPVEVAPMPALDTQPATDQSPVEDLPLRSTDEVKKGEGLLEVVCGKSDTVYVDNKLIGSGPVVTLGLDGREEPYEVRVKLRGEERVRFVHVKKGRLARVRVAPPWSR